ncbi:MAG: NAD(P)/FAD-dependent oxidoreductase [Chloroflexota bacterium]
MTAATTAAAAGAATTLATRWDAIVIGGGHNGLVCAAYLGRAGLRTLVLERREAVGGAAATAELLPGVRVPMLAHTVGRLRASIVRELGLVRHGLRLVQPAARVTSLRPDGPPITLWGDVRRTADGLLPLSVADAGAWPAFDAEVRALAGVLWRLASTTPPDPSDPHMADLLAAMRLGLHLRGLPERHARALFKVLAQPVADFLEDRFESDALRALLAVRGIRYASLGPRAAGSTLQLLTDAAGNDGGAAGETVYARGGPGALAAALASAVRAAGGEIRTGARVVAIGAREERVTGVTLADGRELEAPIVVSGVDPRQTLLDLLDPETIGPRLGWSAGNLRATGVTAKVNLALAELPRFAALGGLDRSDAALRLRGRLVVAPSIGHLDAAADAAKYGRISDAPWLEATIPSLVDPLLTDGGAASGVQHVMSVLLQSAPATLRDGAWDDARRDALGDLAIRTLETVAPGLGDRVVALQVLTPADLERYHGMTGGHPMHLEPGLDQWYAWRPLLGLARYRLPVAGGYLCGSGAHPGGGVTGVPGRNAAREILADRRAAARGSTAVR